VFSEEAHLVDCAGRSLEEAGITGDLAGGTGIFVGLDGIMDRWKEEFFRGVENDGPVGASPLIFPYTSANALAARLTIAFGLKGQDITIASGPLSFLKAFSYAWTLVSSGLLDRALVCGVSEDMAMTLIMGSSSGGISVRMPAEGFSDEPGGVKTVHSMSESLRLFEETLNSVADGREGVIELSLRDEWGSCVKVGFAEN